MCLYEQFRYQRSGSWALPGQPANSPELHHGKQVRWKPLVLSFCSHALLLAALFLILFSGGPNGGQPDVLRAGEIVLTSTDTDSDVKYLQPSNTDRATDVSLSSSEIFNSQPPAIPVFVNNDLSIPGAPLDELVADAGAMAESDSSGEFARPYELSPDDLKMIEADQKLIESRIPAGPATSISVFGGSEMTGRRFVFLIDRSRSMGEQGLNVLAAARQELARAISQLKPHHLFQVVAYHDRTATIGSRRLLAATAANAARVPLFVDRLAAYGGTNHLNGLHASLAFRPDVIVVMTDGGLPLLHGGQLQAIKRATGSETAIFTIQFGSGENVKPVQFLQQLAQQNSGTWHYVNVRDWRESARNALQPTPPDQELP